MLQANRKVWYRVPLLNQPVEGNMVAFDVAKFMWL